MGTHGGLIDSTIEDHDKPFLNSRILPLCSEVLKKFYTSHDILPIKTEFGQIESLDFTVKEDCSLLYGIKDSHDLEKLFAPVDSGSYEWTAGYEAKL